jgi:ribosomal protein S17
MPKYTVKSGKHHEDGVTYKAGDVVEVTEGMAAANRDRFELVVPPAPPPAPPKAPTK